MRGDRSWTWSPLHALPSPRWSRPRPGTLVHGGECTPAIALVAAVVEQYGEVGLIYVDGGAPVAKRGDDRRPSLRWSPTLAAPPHRHSDKPGRRLIISVLSLPSTSTVFVPASLPVTPPSLRQH
jgi:hypothetical protein